MKSCDGCRKAFDGVPWTNVNYDGHIFEYCSAECLDESTFICAECGDVNTELSVFPGERCFKCWARFMEGKPLERPDFTNGTVNL